MKEGWSYKKLGEVCETLNGLWKGKKPPFVNVGVIRNANFTKDFTLCFDNIEYLDVEERQYSKRKLQKGDLIVEKSGGSEKQPVGRAVLFDKENGEFSFSNFTSVLRIRDKNTFLCEFLYKYLLFIYKRGDTSAMQKATTGIHNIEFEKYLNIDIPCIPLSEQHSIVSRLDSAFSHIDALKANAEKQLNEARKLFQAELTECMKPKEGWEGKKLGDIADIKGGKRVPKGYKLENFDTGHRYIRVSDFDDDGTIDLTNVQYISEEVYNQIKNYTITDNDVYLSIAGTIGKAGIIQSSLNGSNLTENACKLIFTKPVDKRYIYLYTKSDDFKKQIDKATKQTSQPKLAITRLAQFIVPLPPLSDQHSIVSHLDSLSSTIRKLEELQQKTLAECDALKQAMLREVFE